MNNRARAPNPSPVRGLAVARASTPVRSSIPVRIPAPARTSTPARTRNPTATPVRAPNRVQIPARIPNPAHAPTLVQAPNPAQILARAPNPVQTPTSARTPTPIQAPVSSWTPTLLHTPTLVQTATPVRTRTPVQPPTVVQTPTSVGTSTRVQLPAPTEISTRDLLPAPNWIPTPAGMAAPTSSPVGVPITATVPASESFPNSAPPLDLPSESALKPAVSPDKDLSLMPTVTSGLGATQEPLPALTPTATDFLGPILGSTSKADSPAAKLMDSTPGFIPAPILETDSFASTFASTCENIPEDSKILIRVIYCYSLRYILLKRSLELQFPNCLRFEEERSVQATGEFEVFVDGKLVHSKKKGDGFVDGARLQKIVTSINEEIRRREAPQQDAEKG